MRTSVTRSFTFEAAHQLPWHEGKCRHLHGHSYRLEVTVEGPVGDHGIVVDFADIKAVVKRDVIAAYDHRYLNEVPGLENPTSEVVAAWIWERLVPALPGLAAVTVRETCTSGCTYRG